MANTKHSRMNILPVGDRILIQREDMPLKKSAAGIIIPETAEKEKSKLGMVIAVGPGRTNEHGTLIPMSIKPGSKVIFNAGWDNEVKMDSAEGEEFFLVKEADVLAIIK